MLVFGDGSQRAFIFHSQTCSKCASLVGCLGDDFKPFRYMMGKWRQMLVSLLWCYMNDRYFSCMTEIQLYVKKANFGPLVQLPKDSLSERRPLTVQKPR